MAGQIFLKEFAIQTLQDGTSSALANNSQVAAATQTVNNTSGGNTGGGTTGQLYEANFEIVTGFGALPTVGVTIDLYLVPALDSTNYADVDTTNHVMPAACFVGSFIVLKSQTASQRLVIRGVPLDPLLYEAYLDNQSGQQMSAGWILKLVAADDQYT